MILLIMGAPGAGKGTQADLIVENKGFLKLSTGDVFRKHIREKTSLGKKVSELIASGELVDDETTFDLVKAEISGVAKTKTVILDGYPRNPHQAEILKEYMSSEGVPLLGVLFLEVAQDVVLSRISNRRVCKGCGATFHLEYKAPKKEGVCDSCGGEVYQRRDDQKENVVNRLEIYRRETAPLLEFYKDCGRLKTVDGGKSLKDVQEQILGCIEELEKSAA
jgi:adenylate kinase